MYYVCPPVRKIIHSLKLVDYLHVQADNPWYNYYSFLLQADQAFKEGNLLYGEHCQTIAKKFIIISVIIGSCVLIGLSVMLGVLYSG